MKKMIFVVSALVICMYAQAQTEKNIIIRCSRGEITYVEPKQKKETVGSVLVDLVKMSVGANSEHHPEFVESVRSAIAGGIGSARRIRVVDSQFLEGEIQDGEPAFTFDGSIGAITCASRTHEYTDSKGKKHSDIEYSGSISATVNIKNVRTDEILKTIVFNTSATDLSWINSPEKAIARAIERMRHEFTRQVNLAWPMYASIIEGDRVKKDKQKEVYIDLGELSSAFKGMTFNVYTVRKIAGKEAKKEIGRLRITEVMGDDISLCRVTRGGEEIKSALDNGEELLITSTN